MTLDKLVGRIEKFVLVLTNREGKAAVAKAEAKAEAKANEVCTQFEKDFFAKLGAAFDQKATEVQDRLVSDEDGDWEWVDDKKAKGMPFEDVPANKLTRGQKGARTRYANKNGLDIGQEK